MRSMTCGSVFALAAALAPAHAMALTPALTGLVSWSDPSGTTGYAYGKPLLVNPTTLYSVLAIGPGSQTGGIYAATNTNGAWAGAPLVTFTGDAKGGFPYGGLTASASGAIYGSTFAGGNTSSSNCFVGYYTGCGVVYSLTPGSSGATVTPIYTFAGSSYSRAGDGSQPAGDLVADASGALYGATVFGGCKRTLTYASGCGIVFKLTPPASAGGAWTETILHTFKGGAADGAQPGRVVLDANGDIFGTTEFGGIKNCLLINGTPDSRCGTVFELVHGKAGGYTFKLLYSFHNTADGALPAPGLVIDAAGNLIGAATQGGNQTEPCVQFGKTGCGTIFELVPQSTGVYTEKTLFTFTGADGAFPAAPLADSKGNMVGVTSLNSSGDGGCGLSFYCGSVYQLSLLTSGAYKVSVTLNLTGANEVGGPVFGLVSDTKGTLYGMTESNVTSTLFALTGTGFTP